MGWKDTLIQDYCFAQLLCCQQENPLHDSRFCVVATRACVNAVILWFHIINLWTVLTISKYFKTRVLNVRINVKHIYLDWTFCIFKLCALRSRESHSIHHCITICVGPWVGFMVIMNTLPKRICSSHESRADFK